MLNLAPYLVVCLFMQFPPAPVPSLSVGEVIDRWDAGSRLIESYDLVIELVDVGYTVRLGGVERLTNPGETFPNLYFYSHIFKKDVKRFGEFRGDGAGQHGSELLFDGVTFTSAHLSQNNYSIQQNYNIFGSYAYEDYESTYRTVLGSSDRVVMSRERASRLLPREGSLYVVDVPEAKAGDFSNMAWRVWLDPSRNFMPVKWSEWLVQSGQRIRNCDCEVELREVASSVWAPVGAKRSVYNKNKKSPIFGKVGSDEFLKVDMAKSRFNIPIPDDRFVIKIPDGATVTDRIRNVVYTKGASDPDTYLSSLAAEGKKAVEGLPPGDRAPKDLIFVPDRPGFWTQGRAIAAGAVALVVALGAIAVRRMRGRAA